MRKITALHLTVKVCLHTHGVIFHHMLNMLTKFNREKEKAKGTKMGMRTPVGPSQSLMGISQLTKWRIILIPMLRARNM